MGEDEVKNLEQLLKDFNTLTARISEEFDRRQQAITHQRETLEQHEMFSQYDDQLITAFFEKPYVIIPRRGDEEWYLIVPKFFDLNVGYLTKSTDSYNFLFGSRQEEAQFFGRLLHGQEGEGRHYILMTDEEYERYGKRLYGIQEKGFKIRVIRA